MALSRQRALSDLEAQDFAELIGSKNATRLGFKNGLLGNGEVWMDMIQARNLTSHTYQDKVAADIVKDILERFYPALLAMASRFSELETKVLSDV